MKKMPTGVVTTRANGAQWQKQEEPGKGPWRQVKDGSKNTQGRAKQNQMEAAEGTASEEMKGAGHEFAKPYVPKVREWIETTVIPATLGGGK